MKSREGDLHCNLQTKTKKRPKNEKGKAIRSMKQQAASFPFSHLLSFLPLSLSLPHNPTKRFT